MNEQELVDFLNRLKNVIGGQQLQIGTLQYDYKGQVANLDMMIALIADMQKLSDLRERNMASRINDLEADVSKLYCEIAYLKVMSTPPKTFWQRLAKRLKSVLPKHG